MPNPRGTTVLLMLACVLAVSPRPVRAAKGPSDDFVFCATQFGSLADGPNVPLIEKTYGELLTVLGAKLSPESLKRMAESQNPFAVPEQAGVDLGELANKLGQLETMLKRREWLTSEIVAKLSAELIVRASGKISAKEAVAEIVTKTEADHEIALPPSDGVTEQSRDGRYLMSTDRTESAAWAIHLYDRRTRQVTRLPGNGVKSGFPFFSPDGKNILVSLTEGHKIQVVPFGDGQVHWDKSITIGEGDSPGRAWLHMQGKSTDSFVAGDALTQYRYDLTNRTRTEVNVPSFLRSLHPRGPTPSVTERGFIPGTDQFYILYEADKGRHLAVANLSAKGELTVLDRHTATTTTGTELDHVTFSRDGKIAYFWGRDLGNAFYSEGNGRALKPLPGEPNSKVHSIAVNPVNGDIAVGIGSQKVEIRDGVTRELKTTIPVPAPFRSVEFSNDGESLLILRELAGGQIRSVNYRQHIP